jgi:Holliday junction resolvase
MIESDYDILRQKLDEIILTSERFPEGVRELIRQSLVEALLKEGNPDLAASANEQQVPAFSARVDAEDTPIIDRESAEAFSRYLEQYKGVKLNDMEFCGVVARFFTHDISEDLRIDSIDSELLMAAVRIAGRRKYPANPATTLNNAKNFGKFLDPMGKGTYRISKGGIDKLDKLLRERSRWTAQKPLDEI